MFDHVHAHDQGQVAAFAPHDVLHAVPDQHDLGRLVGKGPLEHHNAIAMRDLDLPIAAVKSLAPHQGGRVVRPPLEIARPRGTPRMGTRSAGGREATW